MTCSFRRDAYRVFDLFTERQDVEVVSVKDYIAHPKANGYSSCTPPSESPCTLPRESS